MPFSLRLDLETEAQIRELTAQTGRSKSSVVREALAQYALTRQTQDEQSDSPFRRLSPFIGAVSTGGRDYSKDTHTKYRRALKRKHTGQRASRSSR